MKTRNIVIWAFGAALALSIMGCESKVNLESQPLPQPVQLPTMPQIPQQPVPVAAPTPPPPPATPLVPVSEEVVAETTTPSSGKTSGKGGGGASIDKPLPGAATSGEELAGNYICEFDIKDLPIGPIKVPGFGCKIYKAEDGSLKVGPTTRGVASLSGNVTGATAAGFFITGTYKFPGNKLDVKARMLRQGAAEKYAGKGRGMLNDDKSATKEYKLTMTKQ